MMEKKRDKVRRRRAERKRAEGGKDAREAAEALGIAAGVRQAGWARRPPRRPLISRRGGFSADLRVPRRRHPNLESSSSSLRTLGKAERKHTGRACASAGPIFIHAYTADRPYTHVPVVTMTMSTHAAAHPES